MVPRAQSLHATEGAIVRAGPASAYANSSPECANRLGGASVRKMEKAIPEGETGGVRGPVSAARAVSQGSQRRSKSLKSRPLSTCEAETVSEADCVVSGWAAKNLAMGDLMQLKLKSGLKVGQTSCHTAKIRDYVIEGHVPVREIERLLRERPAGFVGLAVPNMPLGSPGMEYGEKEAYDVLLFRAEGTTEI